jgi:IS30 family transposase
LTFDNGREFSWHEVILAKTSNGVFHPKHFLGLLFIKSVALNASFSLKNVNDAINKLLTPLKHWVKTLTFDNGREFSWHEKSYSPLFDCDVTL